MKIFGLWLIAGFGLLLGAHEIEAWAQAPAVPTTAPAQRTGPGPGPGTVTAPRGGEVKGDAKGDAGRAGEGRGGGTRAGLICRRPAQAAVPARTVGIDRCHGNWLPTDNTSNWDYAASAGADHFNKGNIYGGGGRACTRCPNGGVIRQDFKGLEDWCVKDEPAIAAAPELTATPTCKWGLALTETGCLKPASAAVAAHEVGVERCHGDWNALDNTGNWTYNASQGPDHFNRTSGPSGSRACTKCPDNTGVRVDWKGIEDWCVRNVPAVAASPATTLAPDCPLGFTLGPQ